MEKSKELANAHWSYIEQVLKTSGVQEQEIKRIGFHYVSAMVHGYGHGVEDAINGNN